MATLGVSTFTRLSIPAGIGKLIDVHNEGPIRQTNHDRDEDVEEEEDPSSHRTPVEQDSKKWTSEQIVVGLSGIFVVSAAATFGTTVLLRAVGERLVRRTRQSLFNSLMRQPVYAVEGSSGVLVSRLSTDSQLLANAISEHVSIGARKVLEAVGVLGMMLYLSPVLTGTMAIVVSTHFLWFLVVSFLSFPRSHPL